MARSVPDSGPCNRTQIRGIRSSVALVAAFVVLIRIVGELIGFEISRGFSFVARVVPTLVLNLGLRMFSR